MQVKKSKAQASMILILVLIITQSIEYLPWWSFTISALITGILLTRLQFKFWFFPVGFFCGFLIWGGGTLIFHWLYDGNILTKFGPYYGAGFIFIAGIFGGLLSGLAFYSGKMIVLNPIDISLEPGKSMNDDI